MVACPFGHGVDYLRFTLPCAVRRGSCRKKKFLDPLKPHAQYTRGDISPYFWPNVKSPTSSEWTRPAADGFRDYRLLVHGLVEIPVESVGRGFGGKNEDDEYYDLVPNI